jgi:HEAT repeat protein
MKHIKTIFVADQEKRTEKESQNESGSSIPRLIAQLQSNDPVQHHEAIEQLVLRGGSAVPALVEALSNRHSMVRWGSARVLGRIRDQSAAAALALALEDDVEEVCWRAAEALGALGEAGLLALLRALIARSNSPKLRRGAHHILRLFDETPFAPHLAQLYDALGGAAPIMVVPIAAYHAMLQILEKQPTSGSKPDSSPTRWRVMHTNR